MSKLDWGLSSEWHVFEHGVDRGVFYPLNGFGVPWNGIVSVNEDHSGANEVIRYYDGKQYRSQITLGEYSATVESYTYPVHLDNYEDLTAGLSANSRKGNTYFNFSYRTHTDKGYKIHLVFNAMASPSAKAYSTVNNGVDPMRFSWRIDTVPVEVPDARESAHFVVDSTITYPWVLSRLEDMLYGSETSDAKFPTVEELIAVFEEGSILRIIDHGDGTWTAIGPDDAIKMLNPTTFEITWPSAVYLDEDTYQISSL
jgi:hypothetical protein